MAARCARAGCGRFVGAGTATCRVHAGAAVDDWESAELGASAEVTEPPANRFREQVLTGAYRALAEEGVASVVAVAGAEPGLRGEIGVVRVALARLLEEEPDAGRFAQGVARLVAVAVQAARVQRGLAEPAGEGPLEAALRRMLAEESGSRGVGEPERRRGGWPAVGEGHPAVLAVDCRAGRPAWWTGGGAPGRPAGGRSGMAEDARRAQGAGVGWPGRGGKGGLGGEATEPRRSGPGPGPGRLDLEPATAYEVVTRQMVEAMGADLREIKERLNGLLFLVAGAVVADLALRLAS